jgi:hypothetical protein
MWKMSCVYLCGRRSTSLCLGKKTEQNIGPDRLKHFRRCLNRRVTDHYVIITELLDFILNRTWEQKLPSQGPC